jgi:hypothetical protein
MTVYEYMLHIFYDCFILFLQVSSAGRIPQLRLVRNTTYSGLRILILLNSSDSDEKVLAQGKCLMYYLFLYNFAGNIFLNN